MNHVKPRHIELLAPARDAEVAIEAVRHGADAVYMGAARFGARAQAGNTIDDIARVCDYAHQFDARVYATVNTIVTDDELVHVERMIADLCRVGVDALIVQDMGVLRLDIPPVALHASTQCDVRTPAKARFLEQLGFSQLVLARELTLDEIAAIANTVSVPIEAFVHGALCVCYSGRCQASQAIKGRSANRGECAQMCRLPYDLVDENGRTIVAAKHLLSLRDLNLTDHVEAMIGAGVSSFKIEGRLKDVGYVKNVVAHYRRVIDAVLARRADTLRRSSAGTSTYTFHPDVSRSFNRSFTTYFVDGHRHPGSDTMAMLHTPKSVGQPVGRAVAVHGTTLRLDGNATIVNGDGLAYMGNDGAFAGVRVNRVVGRDLQLATAAAIPRGAVVYRTHDKAMADVLARPSAQRRIALSARLEERGAQLVLELTDERGCHIVHAIATEPLHDARQPQHDRQRAELAKLGDTIYTLREASVLGQRFIPASLLARLRREAVAMLTTAHRATRAVDRRRPEDMQAQCPVESLESADNVANHLAEQVYRDHGVSSIEPALEVSGTSTGDVAGMVVMRTRYCLRRELGACRRQSGARHLPERLMLRNGNTLLDVHCDCATCEMQISVAAHDGVGE